ncbi:MAG: InlB B-repeat-containing protein [Clostridia bacterium]|nr:InlB B-repeat-containing protein [Clostridia bacterium]
MKKLSKSFKIIIIVLISLVVATGIVLGLVFGLKKKENGQTPVVPPAPTPVEPVKTTYEKLAEDVVSNQNTQSVQVESYDISPVTAFNPSFNFENLLTLKNNFFIYRDNFGKKNFVSYVKTQDGTYAFNTSINEHINDDSVEYLTFESNLNYVVARFDVNVDADNLRYAHYEVYNVESLNPVKVFEINTNGKNEVIRNDLILTQNYLSFEVLRDINLDELSAISTIYFYKLNRTVEITESNLIYKVENLQYSQTNYYNISYYDNYFMLGTTSNSIEIGLVYDNEMRVYKDILEEGVSVTNIYPFGDHKLLYEKKIIVDEADKISTTLMETGGEYRLYNNEYYVIDYSNKTELGDYQQTQFSLSNGYGVLTLNYLNGDYKTHLMIQQGVENTILQSRKIYSYYVDGTKIVEYQAETNDEIIYAYDGKFLTESRIFKLDSNNQIENIIDFSTIEGFKLGSQMVSSETFVVSVNGYPGLMNFDGEFLIDPTGETGSPFTKIYTASEKYVLGRFGIDDEDNSAEYKLIDSANGNYSNIEDFCTHPLFLNFNDAGFNYYLTRNSSNVYTLHSLKDDSIVLDSINAIKIYQIDDGYIANFVVGSDNKLTLKFKTNIQFDVDEIEIAGYSLNLKTEDDEITAYDVDKSYDIKDSDGNKYGTIRLQNTFIGHAFWWGWHNNLKITMTSNYYIIDLSFNVTYANTKSYWVKSSMVTAGTLSSCEVNSNNDHSGSGSVSSNVVTYLWSEKEGVYADAGNNSNVNGLPTVVKGTHVKGFPYKLYYYDNYDSSDNYYNTADIVYGDEVSASFSISRIGYSFAGWYTARSNGSKVDSFTCDGDKILYAHWTANTYSISYELDGGTHGSSHPTSATYDAWFKVDNPTKLGFTFTGWKIGEFTSGYHYYNTTNSDTGATEVYSYAEYYNGGGGGPIPLPYGVIDDEYEIVPYRYPNGEWIYHNYTIDNIKATWFKNLRSDTDSVTFTANWSENTYNIEYNLNGGEFGADHPSSALFSKVIHISQPTKVGYTFNNWTLTGMGNHNHYAGFTSICAWPFSGTEFTAPASGYEYVKMLNSVDGSTVTITANWTAKKYYIAYELDGGSFGTSHPTSATYDSWFKVDNPTKLGYTFNRWNISNMTTDTTHYASSSESITNAYSSIAASFIPNATRLYYLNLRSGGANSDSDKVLFTARWTANTYNIQYVAGGGTLPVGLPTTATYDSWIALSAPTAAPFGYDFNGWSISGMSTNCTHYASESASNEDPGATTSNAATMTATTAQMYFLNLTSVKDATVTITVRWSPHTYNISYDYVGNAKNTSTPFNAGTNTPSTANYDAEVVISKPTRGGYEFIGWTFAGLDDDCSHYYKTTSSASWTKFESTNGLYLDSTNVNYNQAVNAYSFKNLQDDGTVYLTANWNPIKYTITYHYFPINFDALSYGVNTLNVASNYTETIQQTEIEFDSLFTTFKPTISASGNGEVPLPNGLKSICWGYTTTAQSGGTQLATIVNGAVTGTSLANSWGVETTQKYTVVGNAHAYLIYDYASILIKHVLPKSSGGIQNNLSTYELNGTTDTVKYGQNYTLPPEYKNPSVTGWMISANKYTSGTVNEESITDFTYGGSYYIANENTTIRWIFSNTLTYDFDSPVFYIYAIYA